MATKVTPFGVDLIYGDDKGADNWHIWTDVNYTKLSALSQIAVEGFVSSLPAADNGKRYILTTTNELVSDYELTHHYTTAFAGLRVLDKSDGSHWFFDGATWLDEDDYGDLPAILGCVYALDASAAELITFGFPNKLTPSALDQKGTYIQESISKGNGMSVTGGPATASPLLLNAGKKAIRFILTAAPQVDAGVYGDIGLVMGAIIYTTTPSTLCQFVVEARKNGEFQLRFIIGASTVLTIDNRVSGTATGDILFDAVTGEITFWLDNVQQVLSSNVYTPTTAFPVFSLSELVNDVGNTGSVASIEMVTTAASITGTTFPVGTTDICGNTI